LGEQGSVALDQEGKVLSQAADPIRQVDTTGAGDAFGSGLVWSLLRGLGPADALRVANACGALIAAREGILEGLPRPSELDAFMQRAGPD